MSPFLKPEAERFDSGRCRVSPTTRAERVFQRVRRRVAGGSTFRPSGSSASRASSTRSPAGWCVSRHSLHAGQIFAVVLGKPVLGTPARDDTDIEPSCEDGKQATDRLAFATWGLFESPIGGDRDRRLMVVRNVGSEELGGREQILETHMALPELWHEIGTSRHASRRFLRATSRTLERNQ